MQKASEAEIAPASSTPTSTILLSFETIQTRLQSASMTAANENEIERLLHKWLVISSSPIPEEKRQAYYIKFMGHLQSHAGAITCLGKECQLEHWNQRDFLYLHSYSLITLYQEMRRSDSVDDASSFALIEELYISLNAYRILRDYTELLTSGEVNSDAFNRWISCFIEEIKKQDEPGLQFCVPCGTSDHAIYLSLSWKDQEKLELRIDNLIDDPKLEFYHQYRRISPKEVHAYPFFPQPVLVRHSEEQARLIAYLKSVMNHRVHSAWEPSVIRDIYGEDVKAKDVKAKDPRKQLAKSWPAQRCQEVNNCVYENYEVGMKYRLWELRNTKGEELIDWIWSSQVQWSAGEEEKGKQRTRDSFGDSVRCRQTFFRSFVRRSQEKKDLPSEGQSDASLNERIRKRPTEVFELLGLMPEDNPAFTGRVEEFAQLRQFLTGQGQSVITQHKEIVGTGGIGKSQLVAAYVHEAWKRSPKPYNLVIWLDASPEALSSQFRQLAGELGLVLEGGLEDSEVMKRIYRLLTPQPPVISPRVLLIFDGAKDYPSVYPYLPKTHDLPGHHLIITSRDQTSWPVKEIIPLKEFNDTESLAYFKSRLGDDRYAEEERRKQNCWQALATRLGHFPLALAQSAAYLEQNPAEMVQGYLQMYDQEKARIKLLDVAVSPGDEYQATILTTWRLSVRALFTENAAALDKLILSAYLNGEAIPLPLLYVGIEEKMEQNEIVKILRHYSLVELLENKQGVRMHQLVQEVIRLWIKEQAENPIKEVTPTVLDIPLNPEAEQKILVKLMELLLKESEERNYEMEEFKRRVTLTPHMSSVLSYVVPDPLNRTKETNELVFGLRHQWGNIAYRGGDYKGAQSAWERLLTEQETYNQTRQHVAVAGTLNNLATVLGDLGDLKRKKELLEEALAIKVSHYGTRQHVVDLAITQLNFGVVCAELRLWNEAETSLLLAHETFVSVLSDNHDYSVRTKKQLLELEQAKAQSQDQPALLHSSASKPGYH